MNEQNFKIEEKEIKELAKTIVEFKETNGLPIGKDWHSVDLSEYLIKAGYRKADEVRKETAKEIADWLRSYDYYIAPDIILKKYGVEVDG